MALGSLTSCLRLFSRTLKAFLAFPAYLILQSSHSSEIDEIDLTGYFLEYSKCSVGLITFEMLRFYYVFTTKCP